jgi:Papain family cysteine protease/Alpha/beta hydrolase of unknown function (DUF900)
MAKPKNTPQANAPSGPSLPPQRRVTHLERRGHVFSPKAASLGNFKLTALPDMPDLRDRIYEPTLRTLTPTYDLAFPKGFEVSNQGESQACTGFSLAHVLDALHLKSQDKIPPSSQMMLYHMAKLNDEWDGTGYEGSSIRGALKGLARHGVCARALATFDPVPLSWEPSVAQSKDARNTRLGAYYRLRPEINDYHAAINEVGAVYVSAIIHKGWSSPKKLNGRKAISFASEAPSIGGHAFAIVGYDAEGFIVLNSWGEAWGDKGRAHWSYADWAANVVDAWVLQLAVTAPSAFGLVARQALLADNRRDAFGRPAVSTQDIKGHFINIDDGVLQKKDPFATPDMAETAKAILDPASNNGKGYQHLVLYAHGGLNGLDDEAHRIAGMRPVFKRYGIYNLHMMWGTDFLGEIFQKAGPTIQSRMGGIASDISDAVFEQTAKTLGGARVWRHIKEDAQNAFTPQAPFGGGIEGLLPVLSKLATAPNPPKIHIVAHSAGSILVAHFLNWLASSALKTLRIDSIHLMAPACQTALLTQAYKSLASKGTPIRLYNLSDKLEQDDFVGLSALPLLRYHKSLLYLVSNAFEPTDGDLAGMEKFAAELPTWPSLEVTYAKKDGKVCASTSHGGFDNDGATLTTIISHILGTAAKPPVKDSELTGY